MANPPYASRKRRELTHRRFKPSRCVDQTGNKLFVDIQAALVFRQIAFVVRPLERLHIRLAGPQRMNKRLKDNVATIVGRYP